MKQTEPLDVIWWLVSRASGIVALVLISATVLLGLAMAARAVRRPAIKRMSARLHEHLALAAIAAIGLHGAALLGDHWLKPGWRGITIPFALSYRPAFTGIGILAGYLAILLGPSFYLRRRLGTRRWRSLHRLTVVIWVLSAGHALGAGSDASKLWLRALVLAPSVLVVYLVVLRLGLRRSLQTRRRDPVPVRADARPRSMTDVPAPSRADSPTPASVGAWRSPKSLRAG